MKETAARVSGRQLARILGYAPSYIPKLKRLGVLSRCYDDKKKIDVEVAVQEIEQSRDPAKEHVRQRWEQHRAGTLQSPAVDTQNSSTIKADEGISATAVASDTGGITAGSGSGTAAPGTAVPDTAGPEVSVKRTYADEKAEQAKVDTELKRLKLLELGGELVKTESVRAGVLKLCSDIRDKLLALPDRLHNQLAAETEPNAVHAILDIEIRKALDELADHVSGPQLVADRISAGQRH